MSPSQLSTVRFSAHRSRVDSHPPDPIPPGHPLHLVIPRHRSSPCAPKTGGDKASGRGLFASKEANNDSEDRACKTVKSSAGVLEPSCVRGDRATNQCAEDGERDHDPPWLEAAGA